MVDKKKSCSIDKVVRCLLYNSEPYYLSDVTSHTNIIEGARGAQLDREDWLGNASERERWAHVRAQKTPSSFCGQLFFFYLARQEVHYLILCLRESKWKM